MTVYRGAFHLHSRHSYDSEIEFSEMRPLLKENGFSFAFMTEHAYDRREKRYLNAREVNQFFEDCRRYSTPDFLFIPGFEFYAYDNQVHIVGTPVHGPVPFESLDTAAKIIDYLHQKESLALLVHPFWVDAYRLVTPEEFQGFDGFEVWNYNYQDFHGPSFSQYQKLRSWLEKPSRKLLAVAGLDLHKKKNVAPVAIEMELSELDEKQIFRKFRTGEYQLNAFERTFSSRGEIDSLVLHLLKREQDLPARLMRYYKRWRQSK